jgi:hypothetical protein
MQKKKQDTRKQLDPELSKAKGRINELEKDMETFKDKLIYEINERNQDRNGYNKVKLDLEIKNGALVERINELVVINDTLITTHKGIKQEIAAIDYGKIQEILVPAFANKARVIKACRAVEGSQTMQHGKKFIEALRLYIEDHCT